MLPFNAASGWHGPSTLESFVFQWFLAYLNHWNIKTLVPKNVDYLKKMSHIQIFGSPKIA